MLPQQDEAPVPEDKPGAMGEAAAIPRSSRLPRRAARQPSVAELVRKYQDFLPPQGVHDLTKTALAPRAPFSESEQEYTPPIPRPMRNKSRHRMPSERPSVSDFEQGYAANVAPRYLTHSRRPLTGQNKSRIPGPALQAQDPPRRPSPEKRLLNYRGKDGKISRPTSPTNTRQEPKPGRQRPSARSKEKTQPLRPSSNSMSKSTFRRPPSASGGRVSSMTKHYERLGRDAERTRTRYSVIRGRRARPVASARATVEVLESVKDVVKDESEPSDSSSEADDEDEGVEEERPRIEISQSSPEPNSTSTEESAVSLSPTVILPDEALISTLPDEEPGPTADQHVLMPPSPFLSSTKPTKDAVTPPTSDAEIGMGPEPPSILGTISGFWRTSRITPDDDPMNDPEHIFRDSSMVVRTDEPTSIIALALK